MPYDEYAQCPDCGKTAHGKDEIEKLFGYRTITDSDSIPHSWCRECRETDKENNKEEQKERISVNITNEEKNLLAKLASGELDGVVGEETPCAEYKGTYCGKFIKDGEPVEYWQVKPSRPIDKGIGRFDCKRSQKVYNTDECKLEFLREYGWLMKDNDARQYSARFKSGKQS